MLYKTPFLRKLMRLERRHETLCCEQCQTFNETSVIH